MKTKHKNTIPGYIVILALTTLCIIGSGLYLTTIADKSIDHKAFCEMHKGTFTQVPGERGSICTYPN